MAPPCTDCEAASVVAAVDQTQHAQGGACERFGIDADLVALGKVKGLSLPKRRALLVELGSISRVAEATEAELRAVSGIGPTLAARVIAHFAASSPPSPLPSWEVVELEK